MAEIIFGIDHGNGNMKGENVCGEGTADFFDCVQ